MSVAGRSHKAGDSGDYDVEIPDEGATASISLTFVQDNVARVESVPFMTEDFGFGDQIRVEDNGGHLVFKEVVQRGGWKVHSFILGSSEVETAAVQRLCENVIAHGGHWERVMQGGLFLCLPPGSRLDPTAEFERLRSDHGELPLNRYDGRPLLGEVQPENVVVERDQATIELQMGGDEFSISFPALDGGFDASYLDLAKDVLEHLADFDNQIQTRCAEECERSGVRSLEPELAYVMLRPNTALLRYWTTAMNTEWDEVFRRTDGTWAYVGIGQPDFHERVR